MKKQCKVVCVLIVAGTAFSGCGGGSGEQTSTIATKAEVKRFSAATQVSPADFRKVVQQLYIAYFGRPADVTGLANFSEQLMNTGAPPDIQALNFAYKDSAAVRALINGFGASEESNALYAGDTNAFVKAVYLNVLGRAPDPDGFAFWVGAIDSRVLTKANASFSIMAGALANTTQQGLRDAALINKRVAVGENFTASLNTPALNNAYSGDAAAATARAMLAAVTGTTNISESPFAVSPVLGTIAASATWTKAKSPYVLTGKVMIPGNVVLSIDPGVVIFGNRNLIQIQGTLAVNGTAEEKVLLSDLIVDPAGSQEFNHLISIKNAKISGGNFYGPTGNAIYGNLILTDSNLDNVNSYIYLWYPTGTNKIERNIFSNTGGISYGLSDAPVSLTIKNNKFVNWRGAAVENWAMYGAASADVSLNSFLSTDRIAIRLPSGYTSVRLHAANNYWGTANSTIIDSMIFDKNDDLLSNDYLVYTPMLSAPDMGTPN